ncbi:hypothetical protein FJT64_009229 [Amphibalanus amphitrite]|uniref:Uncharacterized protein n=1 Tax=Amphibalanus amphitrite TaxID=1232801 RepID=A0A6A4V9A7_AMPAM|nr:hypothetical protein FJT64_009229 [Amphibalanus amphitrite]
MIDTLVGYVEASPQLTLKEIANKLREETGVQLSTNTVHKHLSGRMYTVKKVLPEPTEHRLRYLERNIDAAMPRITPIMCMHACNHVQKHFAGCLALMDLAMGV